MWRIICDREYFGGGGRSPPTAKYQYNLLFVINSNRQYFDGGGRSPPTAMYQYNLLFVTNSTLVEEGQTPPPRRSRGQAKLVPIKHTCLCGPHLICVLHYTIPLCFDHVKVHL